MKDKIDNLQALGSKKTEYKTQLSPEILETFPNQFPDREYQICFTTSEFTSLCPKTGQPDFATVEITYMPDKKCIETKSLKLYLFSFRQYQTFMETATNTILQDLIEVVSPKWMKVNLQFTPRGGIKGNITVEWSKE